MKNVFVGLCVVLFLVGCDSSRTSLKNNGAFDTYKKSFVERLWKQYPSWASSVGMHDYDSVLRLPNAANRANDVSFAQLELDSLNQFDTATFTPENKIDLSLIRNQLESTIWSIQRLKQHEWDPSSYNVCGGFSELLASDHTSLEARLKSMMHRINDVPAFYVAARQNITQPTQEHTQLAVEQNEGGKVVFTVDLPEAIRKSKLSETDKTIFLDRCKSAANAIDGYVNWLKSNPFKAYKSFRLGKKLYAEKFAFDIQSGYSAQEVYQKALKHKTDLLKKMEGYASQLWPVYFGAAEKPSDKLEMIRKVIEVLSMKHTQPENFQSEIEAQIPTLTAFVTKKQLLYIDPSKPLVVRKEPAYMAGVAGASISAPGPYDKNGKTYYNVGSMNGWEPKRAESYLREYNDYILQILNIHEAIPGHYTQLVYSNNAPSLIKSILGNGAMVEGWAVYTERMMLENGYGALQEGGEATPEMWLMYCKWNMRTTCNTILDYSVHNRNMTKEQAITLLTKEAFQEAAEAEGKWKRATLTQVQLCSYYAGFAEIMDLRTDYQKQQGKSYSLKQFHEKFLHYGSAPVRDIRKLMLVN